MKNRATRSILHVAITSATTTLKSPRSTNATAVVMTVNAIRPAKTRMYDLMLSTCSLMSSPQVAVNQVQQREQVDPDDIHEVPVQAGDIHRCHVLGRELALVGLVN